MAQAKVAIALPEEVLSEIDELATKNFSSRSHTIVRIWLEWKAFKARQAENVNDGSEAEASTDTGLKLALAA